MPNSPRRRSAQRQRIAARDIPGTTRILWAQCDSDNDPQLCSVAFGAPINITSTGVDAGYITATRNGVPIVVTGASAADGGTLNVFVGVNLSPGEKVLITIGREAITNWRWVGDRLSIEGQTAVAILPN
jgi:hypothetical protein